MDGVKVLAALRNAAEERRLAKTMAATAMQGCNEAQLYHLRDRTCLPVAAPPLSQR